MVAFCFSGSGSGSGGLKSKLLHDVVGVWDNQFLLMTEDDNDDDCDDCCLTNSSMDGSGLQTRSDFLFAMVI